MPRLRRLCLAIAVAACLGETGCGAKVGAPPPIEPTYRASRCGLARPKVPSDWTSSVTVGGWLLRYPSDWIVFGSGVRILHPQADFHTRLESAGGSLLDLDFAGFHWAIVDGEKVDERCSSGPTRSKLSDSTLGETSSSVAQCSIPSAVPF